VAGGMTARARAAIALCLILIAGLAWFASPADAHPWDQYFAMRWGDPRIDLFFDTSYVNSLGPDGMDRAQEAASTWSLVPNNPLYFQWTPGSVAGSSTECEPNPVSVVLAADLPAENVGRTRLCYEWSAAWKQYRLTKAAVAIANAPAPGHLWYKGTGTPPTNQQLDLKSTLTHELGHAMGYWSHFSDSGKDPSVCWPNATFSAAATMCQPQEWGSTWMRALAEDDVHTLVAAYNTDWPPPQPTTTTMSTSTTTTTVRVDDGGGGKVFCNGYDVHLPRIVVPGCAV
jgi:hypothetical protein